MGRPVSHFENLWTIKYKKAVKKTSSSVRLYSLTMVSLNVRVSMLTYAQTLGSQRMTGVMKSHHLVTMNVFTSFHSDPS